MSTTLDSFDPTDKQREILRLVFKSMDGGEELSFENLKAGLSYGAAISKQALSSSLKYLRKHGAVELVYGDDRGPFRSGLRCYVKPTPEAYRRFRLAGSL